jgi:hypothetical protein
VENSLFYNNTTKQFYSFLNETIWTKYLNTNVITQKGHVVDSLITLFNSI